MANTSINIRMDADLKRQFEAFCADMGMTMTTAFNVFARKAVREYRIPFEISGDVPNAETVEAIKEVKRMKQSEYGYNLKHTESSHFVLLPESGIMPPSYFDLLYSLFSLSACSHINFAASLISGLPLYLFATHTRA